MNKLISQKRIVETFVDLVKIDSPSGAEEKMAREVIKRLKNLGLSPRRDDYGNVFVSIPGNTDKERLMLCAHLDTVEPGRGVKPKITARGEIVSSGDTILGADNKASVAAIIEAITVCKAEKFSNNCPMDIVFTREEEAGTFGAANLDYSLLQAKKGHVFDSARPLGTLVLASPFYNRFDIEIIGRSAHASLPEQADNTIDILALALANFKRGKLDEETYLNIRVAGNGDVRNTVPGWMKLEGEVRSYSEEKVENATENVRLVFEQAIQSFGSPSLKINFSKLRENGGFRYEEENDFIKEAKKVIKSLGLKPDAVNIMGCSDVNIFTEHDLMVLNHGSGVVNPHTREESIKVKDLMMLGQLVYSLITS